MLLPQNAYPRDQRKRKRHPADDAPSRLLPDFRPGKNPAILGGIILVFIILGTLLSSRFQTSPETPTLAADPIAQAWREIDALTAALVQFQKDTGRFPRAQEGLVALVQNPGLPGWKGHYVNLIQPDPWKTPYRYTPPPDGPEVRSAGPDRTFHTDADIYKRPDDDG